MLTCPAVLNGDRELLLGFDEAERPLALQLGGDDPEALARCAVIAQARGYDEINLNVGCPSDRVQSGNFGVCLMREPSRVAACVAAMREAVELPVTIKHRIGVDELDRYEDMARFVEIVAQAGCDRFTVHARKAWLHGLSPKQNRTVPPLRYADVHRLAREFPQLIIEINGGIQSLPDVIAQLEHVDAVMIGRAAWDNPWMFAQADRELFGETAAGADSCAGRERSTSSMSSLAGSARATRSERDDVAAAATELVRRLPGHAALEAGGQRQVPRADAAVRAHRAGGDDRGASVVRVEAPQRQLEPLQPVVVEVPRGAIDDVQRIHARSIAAIGP